MKEKYLFKQRRGWLGRILIRLGLAPNHKRVPIFGIQAVGKSYFIFSIAYFVSHKRLGKVIGEGADFINRVIPFMLERKPLDATTGNRDIELLISQIFYSDFMRVTDELAREKAGLNPYQHDPSLLSGLEPDAMTPSNLFLSTNDLSGLEFKNAMLALSEPNMRFHDDPLTKKFMGVVERCDGIVAIVDLVRRHTRENFVFGRDQIRKALAEQVLPLIRGIELAIERGNYENRVFPLFLVFTKKDVHCQSREVLDAMVREIFAIMLARLEDKVKLRIHAVTNMGFGEDTDSLLNKDSEGIGMILADLHHWVEKM